MSRVHDALRRAEQAAGHAVPPPEQHAEPISGAVATHDQEAIPAAVAGASVAPAPITAPVPTIAGGGISIDLLRRVRKVAFTPSPDSHLIDVENPHEAPAEEFRSLRTRLNHM